MPHLLLDADFFFDFWIIFEDSQCCFLVLAKLCDRLCAVIPFCKKRLLFFRLVTGLYLSIQDFPILDEQLYFAFSGLNEVLYGGYIRQLFSDFEKVYEAEDRHAVQDERWSVFTREQIAEKGNSLDLGLIRDDSVLDYNDLPDPAESAEEAAANLEEAVDLLMSVVKELRALEVRD